MDNLQDVHALRTELAAMRAELDELRQQTSGGSAPPESSAAPSEPASLVPAVAVNRRQWMKAAAAAAVGGTAIALGQSQRVAAANGEDLVIGNLTSGGIQLATSPTQLNYTGAQDNAFVVQSGTTFSANSSSFDAAISGWTSRAVNPVGVYGFSNNQVGSNGKGVLGRSDSAGTVGVEGRGPDGVRGFGGFSGAGVRATGGTAVDAQGTVHGLVAQGGRAALLLTPTSSQQPPLRAGTQTAGEVDGNIASTGPQTNELWVCVASGTPGTWRRIAGPGTAGSLVPVNPVRVYDSRLPAPTPGRLSTGENRVVSVADGRDTGNGVVITPDAIPAGATAVAYNLTLDATALSGFLSVTPGDAASSPASSINWATSGVIIANAGIVKLDASRQVKVFCGGGGSTHFILDITGYYL